MYDTNFLFLFQQENICFQKKNIFEAMKKSQQTVIAKPPTGL